MAAFLAFTYVMGWSFVNPFFPLYFESILGNYTNYGVVMFLFFIFAFLLDFPLGEMLEKVRPKTMIMIGLLLFLPMGFIILQLSEMWHFVLYSFYHALASVTLWLSLESYVRLHSPKGKEMLSFGVYDFGWVIAMVTGAIIGGLIIAKTGWNLFYTVSIFAFISLFVLAFLPDKKRGNFKEGLRRSFKLRAYSKEFKALFKNVELRKMYLNVFLYKFCYGFLPLMLPLFFLELNASFTMIGVIYAVLFLPAIFEPYYASLPNKKRIVIVALVAVMAVFIAMFFVKSLIWLFILTVLAAIPFSMIQPIFQGKITQLIPKKKMGEMTGMLFSTTHVALGLGPLVTGILADSYGIQSMFLVGAGFFLIMLVYNVRREF